MKYIHLIVFLCLLGSSVSAQDTLYKRNGEVVAAKITEIGTAEIKYKRFSMQDGPLFVVGKNEVQKIRFANGVVDSFAVSVAAPATPSAPASSGEFKTVQPSSSPALSGLISNPRGGIYYYNGARINEKRMLLLAFDKNRSWKNKELEKAITAASDFKRNQYIAGFGGPAVFLACMIAAGQSAQNNANGNVAGALVFNGFGILVASQIISPIFKGRRSRSARQVVMLFNEQVRLHQSPTP